MSPGSSLFFLDDRSGNVNICNLEGKERVFLLSAWPTGFSRCRFRYILLEIIAALPCMASVCFRVRVIG